MNALPPTLVAIVLSLNPVSGQTLQSASVTGNDITKYTETPPGELLDDPSAPLLTVLQGTATAAGGNIELFASSDLGSFLASDSASPFASVTPTVLNATFDNAQTVTVRSLNGNDWFIEGLGNYNTGYGADNLANRWYEDFLGAITDQGNVFAPGVISGNEENLFNSFRANGGFAQISDPNISYIELAPGEVTLGLAGFLDAIPRIAPLLGVTDPQLRTILPNGLKVSEVAIVDEIPVYSFSAVPSGVVLLDGGDSYSATYVQTIPEPSSLAILLVGSMLLLRRRNTN